MEYYLKSNRTGEWFKCAHLKRFLSCSQVMYGFRIMKDGVVVDEWLNDEFPV